MGLVSSPLHALKSTPDAPSPDAQLLSTPSGDVLDAKLGSGTRTIRLAEVREHDARSEQPWVVRGNTVYDITSWVDVHPGGRVILNAAGGSLAPYWDIFKFHSAGEIVGILDQYAIGTVDPRDLDETGNVPSDAIADPFADDPERDPRLITHTDRPRNAETPANALEAFVTDSKLHYVRNHLWVPKIDPDDWRLTVTTYDGEEKSYSLAELRERFPVRRVHAVMQCSGNRRSHMSENAKHAAGLPWSVGAISNALWEGVPLRDILLDAGVTAEDMLRRDLHSQFSGAEGYGSSIPLVKAGDLRGDVIVCFSMNGEPLPRDHGGPARIVVPGHVAARSCKWVTGVTIADEESTSQWQRRDYRIGGPNLTKPIWAGLRSIQETPINSAITSMRPSTDGEYVTISGWAYAGGGRAVERVDLSLDAGQTWRQALLNKEEADRALGHQAWSWTLFQLKVPRSSIGSEVVCKAVDSSYNSQPDSFPAIWNVRDCDLGAY